MLNFKILIVEDNLSFALEIEMLLRELGYESILKENEGEAALKTIYTEKPDLILMDININGAKTGLDIAAEIRREQIPVIFITVENNPESYNEAKKNRLFAYLVKPFDLLTLQSTIEAAMQSLAKPKNGHSNSEWTEDDFLKDYFLIKNNKVFQKVHIQEIHWIEANGNYCYLNTNGRKYVVKMSLRKILTVLSTEQFMQIQKSLVVRLDSISKIDVVNLRIGIGSKDLPLGRSFKDELLERFKMLR